MEKEINNNGYDYVDLGLPSGTLWATCNVGASKPSEYGLYFQWGDTSGYTKEQVGSESWQKKFAKDWNDYKWNSSGDGKTFTKYTTYGAALELEDDAAHVHMGGDWHMPTPEQMQELLNNTTSIYKTLDGVKGRLFVSNVDTSKSIFIPAAGWAMDGLVGDCGCVWTSKLSDYNVGSGHYLGFDSKYVYPGNCYRYYGQSVRGVIDKKPNTSKEKTNNEEMNENLNLVEILKNVPKGTKLYSPICGECKFVEIVKYYSSLIRCEALEDRCYWLFRSDGSYGNYKNAECLLFPSKDNRDWSTFKVPNKHKHFEQYQKVLVKEYGGDRVWVPELYGYYNTSSKMHYLVGVGWAEDKDIIPYEGNEDKVGKAVE